LDEVEQLLPFRHLNALNTVGYKELLPYFDGLISLESAIENIKTHSRRYAKRQMTWFRKDESIRWFDADDNAGITAFVRQIIDN
jgi:tRNA dimethylallyltransferase